MWREALSVYIQDVRQRQRIALALGVHPLTLVRWTKRISVPRLQNLRDLPDSLPEQRDEVLQSILEEFPALRKLDYKESINAESAPADFSREVLNLLAVTAPALRFTVLCEAILTYAINALDPHKLGIAIFVARCMPPSRDQKVCSLLTTIVRGSASWQWHIEQAERVAFFLGVESLAGQAMSTLDACIATHLFNNLTYPSHHDHLGDLIQSAIATPILHLGGIGGCLIAVSSRPRSFLSLTQRNFKYIANLIALSFDPATFYPYEQIDLALLPEYCVQRKYIASYDQRLSAQIADNAASMYSQMCMQTGQSIWSDIEKEVLQLSPDLTIDKQRAAPHYKLVCTKK